MVKRGKKKEEVATNINELNKSMIVEIIVLVYFIVSMFLRINIFITLPITIALFSYEEYRIRKIKERIGFNKGGEIYRILGIIISFVGFAILISSPIFIKIASYLIYPIVLIVIGTFIFLISKFYDKPKTNLKEYK